MGKPRAKPVAKDESAKLKRSRPQPLEWKVELHGPEPGVDRPFTEGEVAFARFLVRECIRRRMEGEG